MTHLPSSESPKPNTPATIKFKPSKYADFMQSAKVRTPKYKFYVEIGGEPTAPTILLIMGLGAQSLIWPNEFCERLIDAGFRVIRFDNRDIGKSSKIKHKNTLTRQLSQPRYRYRNQLILLARYKLGLPLASPIVPYDLYDMAEDVNQLMQVLAVERYHVLGMSMGGMIAQILASRYPKQVQKLGLLSTSNNRPFSALPAIALLKTMLTPLPNKTDKAALHQHLVKGLQGLASPRYFNEIESYERIQLVTERKFYPKGHQRQLWAVMATGSLVRVNKAIKQPTLIVHGTADKLIPPSHAKSLNKHIKSSQLVLVDDLGHDIPPALVATLAALFIKHFV